MNRLRFLHISDLHLSPETEHDQAVVLSSLFKDLAEFADRDIHFDGIFFTGDLIAKGKYRNDSADYVKHAFVAPILKATNLTPERIYFCPGNHDVNVGAGDPLLKAIYSNFKMSGDVNALVDEIEKRPYHWTQLADYNAMVAEFGLATPIFSNGLFCSYKAEINGVNVGIACMNSAWRASGKANDEDYGSLLVGERQVEQLHNSIQDADLKVALVHHPLDYLTQYDKSAVQRAVYRHFDALLHGHNHSGEALGIATSVSKIFISNAGCVYQSRDYFNAYTILDVALENSQVTWDVNVREYFESRQLYDNSSRFGPNGRAQVVVQKSNLVVNLVPSETYLEIINEKTNSQLLSFSASDIAPKNLHGIFVEPRLSSTSEKKFDSEKAKGDSVEYFSLRELTLCKQAIFFIGVKESGRTTLLNYICLKANDPTHLRNATHAFYIDLQILRKRTQASLLEAAGSFCGGEYSKSEIKRLLSSGRAIVAFDNLPLGQADTLKLVGEFVSEYDQCKFCFAAEEGIEQTLNNDLIPKIGTEAKLVFIHSFSRKQTRDLVTRWFSESPEIVQEKVDSILGLIRKLSIPQTPFLISVLLWIQERSISFSPVNYSAIIDTFIDGLLNKLTETKDRSNTDSTIKRHFLMELAYAVHASGKSRWTMSELEKFTVDYFEQKALASSTIPFITEMFQKGILISLGDEACFKFDCIRAFFLAQKIGDMPTFADFAKTRLGFLALSAEIDFYTGLHRDRSDFLVSAMQILEESHKALSLDLDLHAFEGIELSKSFISDETKERIQQEVFGRRLTVHEQEKMFDDMEERRVTPEFTAEIYPEGDDRRAPPTPDDPSMPMHSPFIEYFEILKLASMVLRNSELVSDAAQKRMAYGRLIALWSEVLLLLLLTVENVTEQDELKMRRLFPEFDPIMAKYMATLMVPSVVFALVKENMGTNKLEVVVKEHLKSYHTQIEGIMSTFLYVDLRLPTFLESMENFLKTHSSSRYVSELLFFKLMSTYLFANLSESDSKKVERMVGDMFIRLNGQGSKQINDRIKENFIAQLHQKEHQQALLKRNDSEKDKP